MTARAATLVVVDQGMLAGVPDAADMTRAADLAPLNLPPPLQRPGAPAVDVRARE
jgi:hypothetical protein